MELSDIRAHAYFKINGSIIGVNISKELTEYFNEQPDELKNILLKALKNKRRHLKEEIDERRRNAAILKAVKKAADAIINSDVVKEVMKTVPKEERRAVRKIIKHGIIYEADVTIDTFILDQYIEELNTVRAIIEILEKNPIALYINIDGD